jgi:ATP-dependent protease HslVU (ClpYQ) peptidase subunit
MIFKFLIEIILNLVVNSIFLYNIFGKNNEVVVVGVSQVSLGNIVVKSNASKIRNIGKRDVVYYK